MIRQQAVDAIKESLSAGGKTSNGVGPSRRKGHKRDPGALEALQAKLVGFVAKHPGLRIEQINKELGTTTKELQLPMRKLIAEGQVKAKGSKRSTTYRAGGKRRK